MGYRLSPTWSRNATQTQTTASTDRTTETSRFGGLPYVEDRTEPPRDEPRRFDHEKPSFDDFHPRWWGLKF